MMLYLVEIPVRDLIRSRDWYCEMLGFRMEKLDLPHGYALLSDGHFLLALKESAQPGFNGKIVLRVANLSDAVAQLASKGAMPQGPLKTSPEGYTSHKFNDPDGNRIELFEWIEGKDSENR